MLQPELIHESYAAAVQTYAAYGVDAKAAVAALSQIEISIHCWQGDDVQGLEHDSGGASGGIMVSGNFPGKARNGAELRQDIDQAMRLLPGRQRLNLHACYAELDGQNIPRNRYTVDQFEHWLGWARKRDIALDFNGTFFGHPLAADGLTLAHPDRKIRRFWIEHAIASRQIAEAFGRELGRTCVHNIWIPDGMKDLTANRLYYRSLLEQSLEEILERPYRGKTAVDALECKLFGVGLESFTVGSLEFYLGYLAKAMAAGRKKLMPTLDMGHFHPTEQVSDKVSSLLLFWPQLLIHVSRGVRWDSDHAVIGDDPLDELMREIKRAKAFGKVYLATDFFDASINRIAAWVIGTRATQRAVLRALLEPTDLLIEAEKKGRYGDRLALMDEARSLPADAIWNQYCLDEGVPAGADWLADVRRYEEQVLSKRK